jgi:hypothetical protein
MRSGLDAMGGFGRRGSYPNRSYDGTSTILNPSLKDESDVSYAACKYRQTFAVFSVVIEQDSRPKHSLNQKL